jgi:hypothetical protein
MVFLFEKLNTNKYKNFQFGVGSIHDFYGPDSYNVNNFGLFIKTDLF